jgi:hypothetical protein
MIRTSLGLALLASALMAAPAHAQAIVDTTVDIPLSEWVGILGEWVGPLLAAAALVLVRKLPKQLADILIGMRVEQVLQKAITYAINAVAGATKDKPLSINVGNEVVATAVQYVVDHAPTWLVKWMGDGDLLREKIIARLDVEAKASLK